MVLQYQLFVYNYKALIKASSMNLQEKNYSSFLLLAGHKFEFDNNLQHIVAEFFA